MKTSKNYGKSRLLRNKHFLASVMLDLELTWLNHRLQYLYHPPLNEADLLKTPFLFFISLQILQKWFNATSHCDLLIQFLMASVKGYLHCAVHPLQLPQKMCWTFNSYDNEPKTGPSVSTTPNLHGRLTRKWGNWLLKRARRSKSVSLMAAVQL